MKEMNYRKKNVVCILVFLLLFLAACGLNDKRDVNSAEESMAERIDAGISAAKGSNEEGSNTGIRAEEGSNEKGSNTGVRVEEESNAEGSNVEKSNAEKNNTVENNAKGSAEGGSITEGDLVENRYKSILLGNENFICTDLENESLNIGEIRQVITDDDSITISAAKFAVIDLDNDGENEMVLWLQINGISDIGFEVLHGQKGSIYGYTLTYRAFMELKTDGTFTFSSGAADSGIGRLSFSDTGYNIDKQVYSWSEYDLNNELTIQYFANGEPCPEDEFFNTMNIQDQKVDVEWHDLSDDNVNTVFANLS